MSLIRPFDPWKNPLCSCPTKYSLSAYTGCNHGCLYCYASSYIRNFCQVRPKKDFLIRLGREIKKIPGGSHLTLANSSDPYVSLEKKLRLTRKTLEMLLNYDIRISLVTKSTLISRDLDMLKNLKQVIACISITTLEETCAKKLEPGTASPKERLAAVKKLVRYIPVAVRLDPLIYPLTTASLKKTIKAIGSCGAKQIITSTYKAKPDNFKRMQRAFPQHKELWQELYLKKGERKGGYWYLAKKIRKELIDEVRSLALKNGLRFSSCREGFGQLNTASCDGSSLFR